MRYYFIAGEASGDMHAANCIKNIYLFDANAEFAFTGGDQMKAITNKTPDIHITQMNFMGFIDVLKHIKIIKQNFKTVKQSILNFKPDVLILVDYPGFNLRMAKWAFENGIKVDYYISPTVWAWKEGRVEIIKKYVKQLFVILPFEKQFYEKHNYKAHFLGHPLLDAIENKRKDLKKIEEFIRDNKLNNQPIIAVLPGSRLQEINHMLKIMIKVRTNFKEYQFVIAGTNTLPQSVYKLALDNNIKVVFNQTYDLLNLAEAGIIKSGTSTLETALFKLPQVVCYKAGALSIKIAKFFVNIKFISLPNLIMDKPIVKELIQADFSVNNITNELNLLLKNKEYRNNQIKEYENLINFLGGAGASNKIAKQIVEDIAK
ncbi:MAG: lipid-A-disaccharide synthase [Bacteroidia bacterium]